METNLLEQLNTMTVTVADTGDIHSIEKWRPRDATTNPSLITAAAQMPEYRDIVDGALRWAEKKAGGAESKRIVALAIDRLAVSRAIMCSTPFFCLMRQTYTGPSNATRAFRKCWMIADPERACRRTADRAPTRRGD